MKSPILGAAYVARSVNAADNRMINMFPEAIPEGGKEPGFLNRAPGLRLVATVGDGPIRGMWSHSGYLYVVSGTGFYQVTSAYVATLKGTVTGTGPVSMADNGTQLFIACNPDGFIYNYNTDVFAQITDPDFEGAVNVGYLDGYFVFNQPNSQTVWITSLLDGLSVDPLDFASAEGSPDGLVSLIVDHRELWLFGTDSTEVWYNSGEADFPLTRIQGAFNEIGCVAPYSVAKLDNGIFWLGADARGQGIVYRANGYTGQRVSTHAIEYAIQSYGTISDAIAYTYQQEGHAFYVLTFPTAGKTWVYDVAVNSWHERAGFLNGDFVRHRSNCQAAFNNAPHVGDYENGKVYAFDLGVYSDDGQPQKWLRSWRALPTGQNNLNRTTHHSLQLDIATGQLYDTVNQFDPQIAIFNSSNTTPISATQATATWSKPIGLVSADVIVIGAGGSGQTGELVQSVSVNSAGMGGGGGGYSRQTYAASALASTVAITVGLGGAVTIGASGTAAGAQVVGNAGGASSFGALLTANGGNGGNFAAYGGSSNGGTGTTQQGGKGGIANADVAGSPGVAATIAPGGGGSGACFFRTTNGGLAGGAGGVGSSASTPSSAGGAGGAATASGSVGSAASLSTAAGGGGGGGGSGSEADHTAGNGATGGFPGGGGGGGGASMYRVGEPGKAGNGGAGGAGTVIIVSYFT